MQANSPLDSAVISEGNEDADDGRFMDEAGHILITLLHVPR